MPPLSRARTLGLAILLGLAGCTPSPQTPSITDAPSIAHPTGTSLFGSQAGCTPRFENQDGWLGGDVAASIPLPGLEPPSAPRHSVWLFGDSFVARRGGEDERRYPFVHNTIAISTCDGDGRWSMDFAWTEAGTSTAEPRAFFEPDSAADWVVRARDAGGGAPYYWPLSGVLVGRTLVVALLRVVPAPAHGAFGLPFRAVGVDLAQIERPERPPRQWRIRYSALSSRSDLLPAASLVSDDAFLYAFATLDRGDDRQPRGLTRIPLDALERSPTDLEPWLEVLDRAGRFRAGIRVDEARVLMADDATEMSVHFDPRAGAWLAVYSDPTLDAGERRDGATRADAIWLRRAGRLAGPWSAPQVLGRIPGLAERADPLPGEPFCYAARVHPELSSRDALLVTYVCNYFAERPEDMPVVLERLLATTGIYRPHVLRLVRPADQTWLRSISSRGWGSR
ncbi:MAG: hypothetical protein R3F35_07840 [Myxococcota bacterium]